jgi:ATP phosphoribosyltransferase regulatory subunit HisZ
MGHTTGFLKNAQIATAFQKSCGNYLRTADFSEVATPLLEYYDVFEASRAHFPQEDIYKLIDRSGRILVLRPDCTIPIARLVSSRFKNNNEMLKLYYHQSVYRLPHQSSAVSVRLIRWDRDNRRRRFFQRS